MFYDLVLLKLNIILFTTDINCNRCIKNTSLKNIWFFWLFNNKINLQL